MDNAALVYLCIILSKTHSNRCITTTIIIIIIMIITIAVLTQ